MDQCEDREEGVPPSKSSLCGEHDSQTKAQRTRRQHKPDSAGPEPEPEPSCVSSKSDQSMEPPLFFKRKLPTPSLEELRKKKRQCVIEEEELETFSLSELITDLN
eukprot:superscaffoldBa00004404_g18825